MFVGHGAEATIEVIKLMAIEPRAIGRKGQPLPAVDPEAMYGIVYPLLGDGAEALRRLTLRLRMVKEDSTWEDQIWIPAFQARATAMPLQMVSG